jgi:hypothetical protein
MRSGKDTIAEIIRDYYSQELGLVPLTYKFAGPIYRLAESLQRYPHEKDLLCSSFIRSLVERKVLPYYRPDYVESLTLGVTAWMHSAQKRTLIRGIAEHMRGIIPSVWINLLDQRLQQHENDNDDVHIVISDLRFLIEANWCQFRGIPRIRVDVDPEVQRSRLGANYVVEDVEHYGECQLDDYDKFSLRLSNNGTYQELEERVYAYLRQYTSEQAKVRPIYPALAAGSG